MLNFTKAFTTIIKKHAVILDFSKPTFAVLCNQRNEISAGLRIIVTLKSNGFVSIFFRGQLFYNKIISVKKESIL